MSAAFHIGSATVEPIETNWRDRLPVLKGRAFTLRELTVEDAPALFTMLSVDEVARFISPPPTTIEGYEQFIRWTHARRAAGRFVCFGVVPEGMTHAIGLFQVRALEPGFATAEWGFAIGTPFWGSGLFFEGSQLVLDFAFDQLAVHRLEARSAVHNGRGNGALRKIGALQEGLLRRSFLKHGTYYDQVLWTILDSDWRDRHYVATETIQ
jgi:ribosomal-protein-alanine N-acetyltransferase